MGAVEPAGGAHVQRYTTVSKLNTHVKQNKGMDIRYTGWVKSLDPPSTA